MSSSPVARIVELRAHCAVVEHWIHQNLCGKRYFTAIARQ
jgi:hypothetical protein